MGCEIVCVEGSNGSPVVFKPYRMHSRRTYPPTLQIAEAKLLIRYYLYMAVQGCN